MAKSIEINELSSTVVRNLTQWSEEITDGIEKDVEDVATEGAEKLKKKSPKRTGRYARGWRVYKNKGGRVIRNKDKPQLTHLLEHGHLTRNGKRVRGEKHIEPVEEYVIDELAKRIEERIEHGS